MTDKHDLFGDRMKGYEAVETDRVLDAHLPIYARIDGRSFSAFTRGMQRPFDERMTAAMIATTKHLVEETLPRIAYTQSDEISMVWLSEGDSQPLFGAKVHKLTSVLASIAAAAFQLEVRRAFGDEGERLAERLPHFDARVFQLPSKIEAANAVLWRALDARKNAVSMATRAHFSAKAMHGQDQTAMRAMLQGAGVEFEADPPERWRPRHRYRQVRRDARRRRQAVAPALDRLAAAHNAVDAAWDRASAAAALAQDRTLYAMIAGGLVAVVGGVCEVEGCAFGADRAR